MTEEAFNEVVWIFHGVTFPDSPALNLSVPHHRGRTSLGLDYELVAEVHRSQIIATVWQRSASHVSDIRNAVTQDVQLYVDYGAMKMGAGLEAYMTSAIANNGRWQFFDAYIPVLRTEQPFSFTKEFADAIGGDAATRNMLADFRAAMRWPFQTGFFCFRAVEAAMQTFKSGVGGKRDAWEQMRTALHVERSAIDRLKAKADWARHGGLGEITDDDRVELLTTTRSIIERYLDFSVKGRSPLPTDLPLIH